MNTKEKNLSNNLKSYYLKEKFFIDKIESRLTTAGIPDILVMSPMGQEQFVELKVVEADIKLALTPGQMSWHSRIPGQMSWHSRRRMRGVSHPFVILVEPVNKLLVASSRKVLDLMEKGGKLNLEEIPEECWFSRSARDYSMLTYATTDLYYSSSRVYK